MWTPHQREVGCPHTLPAAPAGGACLLACLFVCLFVVAVAVAALLHNVASIVQSLGLPLRGTASSVQQPGTHLLLLVALVAGAAAVPSSTCRRPQAPRPHDSCEDLLQHPGSHALLQVPAVSENIRAVD
jgi:hypothetical protein